MKRFLVVATLLVAAVALAASVSGQGEGAVKVEFDPNVGFVILNTTASGKINATAHLDSGAPNQEFVIAVRIRYEDGTFTPFTDVARLSTNGEGKGNLNVQVDIEPPPGSTTLRRVAFRVRKTGPSGQLYVAVAWDIPLK